MIESNVLTKVLVETIIGNQCFNCKTTVESKALLETVIESKVFTKALVETIIGNYVLTVIQLLKVKHS